MGAIISLFSPSYISSTDHGHLSKMDVSQYCVAVAFNELGLMNEGEMKRLYICFDKILSQPSYTNPTSSPEPPTTITLQSIYTYLKIPKSDFCDQVFTAPIKMTRDFNEFASNNDSSTDDNQKRGSSSNPSGLSSPSKPKSSPRKVKSVDPELDFGSFCMGVWLFTHYELATLTFKMIDVDGSNHLDIDEIMRVVQTAYANNNNQVVVGARAGKIMKGLDVNDDGKLSLSEFVIMVKNYHYLLEPAFQIQAKVRRSIFGSHVRNWSELELRRRSNQATDLVDIVRHIYMQINNEVNKRSFVMKDGDMSRLMNSDAKQTNEYKYLAEDVKSNGFMKTNHRAQLKRKDSPKR